MSTPQHPRPRRDPQQRNGHALAFPWAQVPELGSNLAAFAAVVRMARIIPIIRSG